MTRAFTTLTVTVILVLTAGAPATGNLLPPPCEEFYGPITTTLGGTEWNAHICDDLIVFYSAEGSPANFSSFTVVAANGTYTFTVHGDGTQDAVRATLHEIAAFSAQEIQALIEEMKQVE